MAYPMQQISGPPVGQGQQSLPQQQPVPQSQVPVIPGNAMPTNPMPPLPIPQMSQPAMQSSFQPQPQPQPQHPFSPGPPNAMPESSVPDYGRAPGAQGSARVIPRSFARISPSTSTSNSSSSSSSGTRRATDPLARNPLPALPREAETPADMLAGTAMARTMPPPLRSSSPLKNPLPPPPRDIYTLKKYRPLLVGTAYQDREKEVFPRGWFSDEHGHEREGSLGRVFDRLNPFKSHRSPGYSPGHRRHETMPDLPRLPEFMRDTSTGSESSYEPQLGRRNRLGRPFTSRWRRRDDERGMGPPPMGGPLPPTADGQPPVGFMPISSPAVPGQPQPMHPLSPPAQAGNFGTPGPQPQPAVPLTPGPRAMPQPGIPATPRPPQPQPSINLTPQAMPQPVVPLTPGPAGPQPAHSLSPGPIPRVFAGQGPSTPNPNRDSNPPELRFRQDTPGYGGFCHLSPHRVHYMGKLYPTAAHLFEAFRFLGTRNDLAKHVRKATFDELGELLSRLDAYTRPDWEEILFDKVYTYPLQSSLWM